MIGVETRSASLQVHALASGSSGNSMLIQADGINLLIDAGLSTRALTTALLKRNVGAADLHGILLTHEHTDHSSGLSGMSRRFDAPVIANSATFAALLQRDTTSYRAQVLETGGTTAIGGVGVRSFAVSHDAAEAVGYVLEIGSYKVVYCTDSGCITSEIREALCGANLAIIEANYDFNWLMRGPYPEHRKVRVASDTGHLSNEDCADVMAERLELGGSLSIWLAHLSRVNNSPALARRSVQARIALQSTVPYTIEVALRDQPSLSWSPGQQAFQLAML